MQGVRSLHRLLSSGPRLTAWDSWFRCERDADRSLRRDSCARGGKVHDVDPLGVGTLPSACSHGRRSAHDRRRIPRHPRASGACAVALARPPCGAQAGPKSGLDAGLKSRLRSRFATPLDAGAVLDDPGDPHHPALAGCLLGADDGRNARVPDDPDATVHSVLLRRVLRGLLHHVVQDHRGPLPARRSLAFWSVARGAIPAIWDVILGFIAPDMDLNTVNG